MYHVDQEKLTLLPYDTTCRSATSEEQKRRRMHEAFGQCTDCSSRC